LGSLEGEVRNAWQGKREMGGLEKGRKRSHINRIFLSPPSSHHLAASPSPIDTQHTSSPLNNELRHPSQLTQQFSALSSSSSAVITSIRGVERRRASSSAVISRRV